MQSRLFIHFNYPNNQQLDWLITDESNNIINQANNSSLLQLPPLPAEIETIVLIPAATVLLVKAKLPKTSTAKLYQAIPYAVEEQIATDIESMHFAVGDWQADDQIAIAAVSHQDIRQWLDLLNSHGIQPQYLMPDVLAIPYQEQSWSLVIENTISLLRTGWQSGLAIDTANLGYILPNLINHPEENKPQSLLIINLTQPQYNPLEKSIISVPIEEQPSSLSFLPLVANFFSQNKTINLLQGIYQAKLKLSDLKKTWLKTGMLALLALGFFIFVQLVDVVYLKLNDYYWNSQISSIYKKTFPQASEVVSPKLRMQQELSKWSQGIMNNRFLYLLSQTGEELKNLPQIRLENIIYQNNKLVLKISANSFSDIDQLRQRLSNNKLQVIQNETASHDSTVTAQLTVQ